MIHVSDTGESFWIRDSRELISVSSLNPHSRLPPVRRADRAANEAKGANPSLKRAESRKTKKTETQPTSLRHIPLRCFSTSYFLRDTLLCRCFLTRLAQSLYAPGVSCGPRRRTERLLRAAATAAMTPLGVAPYTTTSAARGCAMAASPLPNMDTIPKARRHCEKKCMVHYNKGDLNSESESPLG